MKKCLAEGGIVRGSPTNDMGNAFIWSGFRYYLRQPTDSYVVFSPVKYWKAQHLVKKQFLEGFAFNRKHFHTNIEACIMVALWANIDDVATEELILTGYDIIGERWTEYPRKLPVKRIYTNYSEKYYDKRKAAMNEEIGILCGLNGLQKVGGKQTNKPVMGDEIIGYLVAHSSGFDNPDLDSSLLVAGRYDGHGFYLHRDNFLEKLPMFAASRYIRYNKSWTERARIMKSADGAERFNTDVKSGKLSQFLLKCLLFTCLEQQNHMRTFMGSDGRKYRNELCLDATNGETVATTAIKNLQQSKKETELIKQWENILRYAKCLESYDSTLTYGVYQLSVELDTSHKDEVTGGTVWDNVELHSALTALKGLVKEYYNTEIVPVLFEYEFIK